MSELRHDGRTLGLPLASDRACGQTDIALPSCNSCQPSAIFPYLLVPGNTWQADLKTFLVIKTVVCYYYLVGRGQG